MKLKHLLPTLLLLTVCQAVNAQLEDELPLPDEKDNQFPPENPTQPDEVNIEGSGAGVLDQPLDDVTEINSPTLEAVEPTAEFTTQQSEQCICPEICTCSIEGDGFIVDCANKGLKEIPSNVDARTTTLNLQNNEITGIPKTISELKNLKVLNMNSNSLTELAPGTVSELPELQILQLANNRLLEYPQELKNAFSLTSLKEIDISGNDIREALTIENFSNFKILRKLAIPASVTDITEQLCEAFKNTLETVCFGSCADHAVECPDAPETIGEEYLAASLPGTNALSKILTDNIQPDKVDEITENTPLSTVSSSQDATTIIDENSLDNVFSRSAVIKKHSDNADIVMSNVMIHTPTVDTPIESDVKVGATITQAKGGVDKSVIAMVVAGMVVVIAGITIKKNWSSLRKRLSSTPRPATEVTINGTTAEEVPLQEKDKSPV